MLFILVTMRILFLIHNKNLNLIH